jgi:hypothetical protein
MKQRYVVCATFRLDDVVRLSLQPASLVKEKKEVNLGSMMGIAMNMDKFQKQMQRDATLMQQPDLVSIPYEEWKKHEYKIDDIIILSAEGEK